METAVLHQVHPLKVTADVTASVISNALLWQHRLGSGLLVRLALPLVASMAVIAVADAERLRHTARGRYVPEHMSPGAQATRLGGDALMAVGAWQRRPALWLPAQS